MEEFDSLHNRWKAMVPAMKVDIDAVRSTKARIRLAGVYDAINTAFAFVFTYERSRSGDGIAVIDKLDAVDQAITEASDALGALQVRTLRMR